MAGYHVVMRSPRALVAVTLVAFLAAPAAAQARPSITSMSWSQRGVGPAGPSYRLVVSGSVRVCARRGPVRIRVRESKVLQGRTRASGTRTFSRRQRSTCQRHRVRYTVSLRFFGVGQYRLRVNAVDRGGVASRTRSKRFPTVDD